MNGSTVMQQHRKLPTVAKLHFAVHFAVKLINITDVELTVQIGILLGIARIYDMLGDIENSSAAYKKVLQVSECKECCQFGLL